MSQVRFLFWYCDAIKSRVTKSIAVVSVALRGFSFVCERFYKQRHRQCD